MRTVLLLQIGAAAHEAQHSLSELDDVCEICVQLETGSAADTAANHSIAPLAPAANIGAWAHPALLALSPRLSLEIAEHAPSDDGTVRLLFRCYDGAVIESVLIPAEMGRDQARTTLCISSQVGCARACTFCETGSIAEIIVEIIQGFLAVLIHMDPVITQARGFFLSEKDIVAWPVI